MAALLVTAATASAQTQQAPPATCQLVKDAYGNLTLDPRCPATVPAGNGNPNPSNPAVTPSGPAGTRFPYPGSDDSASPAPVPSSPQGQATPNAPATGSQAGQNAAPATKRFPFPGETDDAAPAATQPGATQPATPQAGQPPLKDAGSSGQSSSSSDADGASSSSSSSSSSSNDGSSNDGSKGGADDASTDPDAKPARRTRRKLPPVPRQSPSEREAEDVQVAGYYQNDGNFKGAYDRAKEAVSLDKDDAAAHLALAESARRLGKLDEAEQEYKQCLTLDPVPKQRKVAEKALQAMTGGGS